MSEMTLEELNAELAEVGVRPVKSWEEARKPLGTSWGYSETPKHKGGNGKAGFAKAVKWPPSRRRAT